MSQVGYGDRFDMIAIGGGFSGLTSACRAAELGLKAIILEKRAEDRYPCSSRYATGIVNVMGLGVALDPEVLYSAIIDRNKDEADPVLARVIAENGARAVAWLSSHGVRFIERILQRSQPGLRVLAPPRRLQAGLDWMGRGPDVTMRILQERFLALGGAIERGVNVTDLLVENNAVTGVRAARDGKALEFHSRNVVIADGGFAASPDLIAKYITPRSDRVLSRVGPEAKGDGIVMAEKAGAAVGGFGKFYGHLHHRDAMYKPELWPYPHFDDVAEIGVLVDSTGLRFVNEGLGGVCMSNAVAALADPLESFVVFDEAMWRAEPKLTITVPINPTMMTAGGEAITADDIETLAGKMGVPASQLQSTVAAHNAAVETGVFFSLPVARTIGKHKPMLFEKSPYYAVPLCAGVTGTMGGVVIDENAQAQRKNGGPFEGLYVVGTPVAGLEGGPLASYVGGLIKAFVFGLIAAEHMAKGSSSL